MTPGELAQVRVVQLQFLHVIAQVVSMLLRPALVAVPKQPLGPLQLTQQACPFLLVMVGDAAGILLQHRQAHGDVEPVEDVLGFWGDQLGEGAHLLPAIGQERDVLVGLQALLSHDLEQSPLRLAVIAMHQADVARRAVLRHGSPND